MRVIVRMLMFVGVVIVVRMRVLLKQEHADEVDDEAHDSHEDGLVELDGGGVEKPLDGDGGHGKSRDAEKDGAGEATQDLDFPRAENEAMVRAMPVGQHKSQPGNAERHRMGAHVTAVSEERHGMEDPPGDEFHGHHADGKQHDAQRAVANSRAGGEELMLVTIGVKIGWVHTFKTKQLRTLRSRAESQANRRLTNIQQQNGEVNTPAGVLREAFATRSSSIVNLRTVTKKKKPDWFDPVGLEINPRQRATLPRANPAVPSPLRPFTTVFGMGTGVTSSL